MEESIELRAVSTDNGDTQAAVVQHAEPCGERFKWTKVLGGFLGFMNTYGLASSFGSYQTFYQQQILKGYSLSTVSWIGTTQLFLLGFAGLVAGPLYDLGYGTTILAIGGLLLTLGVFLLSTASTFAEVFVTQSICVGIGAGLTYVPAVAIVANSFSAHRPLALGLAASGSAAGGVIFPIIFRKASVTLGFARTNCIIGALVCITSIASVFLLRPWTSRQVRQRRGWSSFLDTGAFRDPGFILLCIGLFLIELGYWVPPFIITPYAQVKLNTTEDYAFYLLAIMNAGGVAGRIIPAFAAQVPVIGPGWILTGGVLALGVLVLSWIGINNVAGITVWCVLVGFMSGITVSFPNAVVSRLSPSASVVGARTGMMWCLVSFAALMGAPIAESLVGTANGSYLRGQLFSGICISCGAALLVMPSLQISQKRRE